MYSNDNDTSTNSSKRRAWTVPSHATTQPFSNVVDVVATGGYVPKCERTLKRIKTCHHVSDDCGMIMQDEQSVRTVSPNSQQQQQPQPPQLVYVPSRNYPGIVIPQLSTQNQQQVYQQESDIVEHQYLEYLQPQTQQAQTQPQQTQHRAVVTREVSSCSMDDSMEE